MGKVLKVAGLPINAKHERMQGWEVTMREEGIHTVFSFTRSSRQKIEEISQRTVREDFLAIRTKQEALAFFQKFGPFQRRDGANNLTPTENAVDVQWAVVRTYQDLYKEFIAAPYPECFTSDPVKAGDENFHHDMQRLFLISSHQRPQFTLEVGYVGISGQKYPAPFLRQYASDVETAIYNSIYIDKHAGLRGAVCNRCDNVFLSDSDKPRQFCGNRCSNAVRQARKRLVAAGKATVQD